MESVSFWDYFKSFIGGLKTLQHPFEEVENFCLNTELSCDQGGRKYFLAIVWSNALQFSHVINRYFLSLDRNFRKRVSQVFISLVCSDAQRPGIFKNNLGVSHFCDNLGLFCSSWTPTHLRVLEHALMMLSFASSAAAPHLRGTGFQNCSRFISSHQDTKKYDSSSADSNGESSFLSYASCMALSALSITCLCQWALCGSDSPKNNLFSFALLYCLRIAS